MLLIIDNVDDKNLLFEPDASTNKTLFEYIPRGSTGSILFTTRNKDLGYDLAGPPVMVPSLNLEEANQLLLKKLGSTF